MRAIEINYTNFILRLTVNAHFRFTAKQRYELPYKRIGFDTS